MVNACCFKLLKFVRIGYIALENEYTSFRKIPTPTSLIITLFRALVDGGAEAVSIYLFKSEMSLLK